MVYLSSGVIPGYEEHLLERTSEELREIAETELEEAELGGERYDLKYRRKMDRESGTEYALEESLPWYEGTEFEDIEVESSAGVEEIELNLMTGETRITNAEGERLYNFCGSYEGETAMLSQIGNDEYALLYDSQENSLEGVLLETGEQVDMSSPQGSKTTLMREIEFIRDFYTEVYAQIFEENNSQDYDVEITDPMKEDLEKLPAKCTDTVEKKTKKKQGKINSLGLEPEQAFNKPMNNELNGILQEPLGSSFRAWFIPGTHLDSLEDETIYGLRAMRKKDAERESKAIKKDSNISSGADYAERLL